MNKVAVGAVTALGGDAVSPEETVRAELSALGRLDVDEIMSHARVPGALAAVTTAAPVSATN